MGHGEVRTSFIVDQLVESARLLSCSHGQKKLLLAEASDRIFSVVTA